MNTTECDVLKSLLETPSLNQRATAEITGYSLGCVNKALKNLRDFGFLDAETGLPTPKARELAVAASPSSAVILAAGFGMRMMPINHLIPKGLLEVEGEPLIERTIRQLCEAGIGDISIVVGFMKESYEYLRGKYGVRLITNTDYLLKNNLHSLLKASEHLGNTYIIPCDIWCRDNPYSKYELRSWYMVGDWADPGNGVHVSRRMTISIKSSEKNCAMIGICYVQGSDSLSLREKLEMLSSMAQYDREYWETAIIEKGAFTVPARVVASGEVIEINTYEQLRSLDKKSSSLNTPEISTICWALKCSVDDIRNIRALKKGMTNRSFLFDCKGIQYIMRIPGEGTDKLINRFEEAEVYNTINGQGICDDVVYIDPAMGYKLTKYIDNARVCDPFDWEDVRKCMNRLRKLHERRLSVGHNFDIFHQIDFYEFLRNSSNSAYKDYYTVKKQVFSLRSFVDSCPKDYCLTHIDAVPDNFLIYKDEKDSENIVLIDWEYSGMQDPHVDIAMFCIYSMYERPNVDDAISAYFPEGTDELTRYKIYAYISMCGLLWSNWCEYKMCCGVDFGEYSLRQYGYAREYSALVLDYLNRLRDGNVSQS